jgi:hypothetical protein
VAERHWSTREIAARAANSVRMLQDFYRHCIDGREDFTGQQIQSAPDSGF